MRGAADRSAASVEAAVALTEWFGSEARRVHALLSEGDEDRELHRLTAWIRARGGAVTPRQLQQSGQKAYRSRVEDAEAALERLVTAGVGAWTLMERGAKGGRRTRQFQLRLATKPQ